MNNEFNYEVVLSGEVWTSSIRKAKMYNNHVLSLVLSHGGLKIDVILGKIKEYRWVCIPDYQAGCQLAHWSDHFYNYESLKRVLHDEYAAMAIATGIKEIGKEVFSILDDDSDVYHLFL